ncbi:MAG: cytochrome C [Bacteroidota bacterium]
MENILKIISKPDNIPIIMLTVLVAFFFGLLIVKVRRNDSQEIPEEAKLDDKVQVWPYLVRLEFLMTIAIMAILIIWSITIDAPLEEPANPAQTPNPSKAPWYFLGLQEMLVYFDPWIAGVLMPTLIVLGLMAIPYLDINEKGSGYYTFKERKFAITVFCFGFIALWVSLIFLGTFLRGPGWNFFWPWEYWDVHKIVVLNNVDLSEFFGMPTRLPDNSLNLMAFLFGAVVFFGYYVLGVLFYFWFKNRDWMKKLGILRYSIIAYLLLSMGGLVIKIVLRIVPPIFGINPVKYIWVTPWFNV